MTKIRSATATATPSIVKAPNTVAVNTWATYAGALGKGTDEGAAVEVANLTEANGGAPVAATVST